MVISLLCYKGHNNSLIGTNDAQECRESKDCPPGFYCSTFDGDAALGKCIQ